MARIRSIKPGFFTNLELADCSRDARLLFIGLWAFADREGRLKDQARKIKIEVFPYDDLDVEPLLDELRKANFIIRYEAKNSPFIQIVNFTKHQRPHKKEAASEIPAPDGYIAEVGQDTVEEPLEESPKPDKATPSREINGLARKLPGKPEKGNDEPVGEWRMENGEWGVGNGNGHSPPSSRAPTESFPLTEINPLLKAFAEVCDVNLEAIEPKDEFKLSENMEKLRNLDKRTDEELAPDVLLFGKWFKQENSRLQNPTPYPTQIPKDWHKFLRSKESLLPKEIPSADPKIRAAMDKRRANEIKKLGVSH